MKLSPPPPEMGIKYQNHEHLNNEDFPNCELHTQKEKKKKKEKKEKKKKNFTLTLLIRNI